MKTLCLFVSFLGLSAQTCVVNAQGGLLVSDTRYAALPLLPTYSGQKFNEIPLKVSLKKYAPVPGDQKNISACVGWSAGYGALTILAARQIGLSDQALITEHAFSAAFVYNQIAQKPGDCTSGAYVEDALQLLREQGDCLEQSFNYEETACRTAPDTHQLQEALKYRIADFASVFELGEPGKSKIAKACKVLATETPLIVGVGVTPDFWTIRPGTILWDPENTATPTSHHAMVLTGYDNIERRFELMNSFGPGWGKGGFIQMHYDDFERLCRYAWVMIPEDNLFNVSGATQPVHTPHPGYDLHGEFVLRTPVGYLQTEEGIDVPYFEEVPTRIAPNGVFYETEKPVFALGDAFQLVARAIPSGRFVYVFSQSPSGRVNLHFPKPTDSGGLTAGFVLDQTAEIVIPSEMSLLQLSEAGTDWLCVLYSAKPVADIQLLLAEVEREGGAFPDRVQRVFNYLLTPPDRLQLHPNKMAFSAQSEGRQMAAALILRVVAQ